MGHFTFSVSSATTMDLNMSEKNIISFIEDDVHVGDQNVETINMS